MCNDLPEDLVARHGNVTIKFNIRDINGIQFIMTISRNIHFGTAEFIKHNKVTTIVTTLRQAIDKCQARGFNVQHILGNGNLNSKGGTQNTWE